MRKIFPLFFLCLFIAGACIIYVPNDSGRRRPDAPYEGQYDDAYGDYDVRDSSYFYEHLSPYGSWVRFESLGYVWVPTVDQFGWRPYTNGRWAWTDQGWLWVSRYNWGWIPFHYGRWGWDSYLGWYWVPGTVWSPAWVAWRTSSLYIGWAPLPPDVRWDNRRGIRSLPYALPNSYWIFVSSPYFYNAGLYRYILPVERSMTIINFTSLRTNIYWQNNRIYNRGLEFDEAQRLTKSRISRYELQNSRQPGETRIVSNRVNVYRPDFRQNDNARPQKVVTREEARDTVERTRIKKFEQSPQPEEEIIQRRQRTELEVMEESQRKEVNQARKEMEDDVKVTKDAAKKQKVKQEHEAEINKLKQKHATEKTKITERHETEKKVVKKKVKKK